MSNTSEVSYSFILSSHIRRTSFESLQQLRNLADGGEGLGINCESQIATPVSENLISFPSKFFSRSIEDFWWISRSKLRFSDLFFLLRDSSIFQRPSELYGKPPIVCLQPPLLIYCTAISSTCLLE